MNQWRTLTFHSFPLVFSSIWWFRIFYMFIPTWGNDPIWGAYFSTGWKPPTSLVCFIFSICFATSFQPFPTFSTQEPPQWYQEDPPAWELGTRNSGGVEVGQEDWPMMEELWLYDGYCIYIYIHTYICVCEYVKSTNYFCSKFMTSLNWCRIFCINQEYH